MNESLKKMLLAKVSGYLTGWPEITVDVIQADQGLPYRQPAVVVKVTNIVEHVVGYGIWMADVQVVLQWCADEDEGFSRLQAETVWCAVCNALEAGDLPEVLTDTDHAREWLKVFGIPERQAGATSPNERELSTVYAFKLLCANMEPEPAPPVGGGGGIGEPPPFPDDEEEEP
jgi:hypothetical protein